MRGPRVLVTNPGAGLYGSDRMALEALRGLVGAGLDARLVVADDGPLVDQARSAGVPVEVGSVPVLRKSALNPRGAAGLALASVLGLYRAGRVLRRTRPDVVYVNTLTTPTWLLAARALGVPVVCHVHEAESAAPAPVRRLLTVPLFAASTLLVNSEFALEVLAGSWPRLRGRSTVVPNGVAGPPGGPLPRRAPGGPARLLYLGRLSGRKGVLVAVEALETLLRDGGDVRLDLVGDAFTEHADFADRLRERIAPLVGQGRVRVHGFDADVWSHLAACDVLLVPSVLPEPFGNVAVEGVLAGRPVVASDVGGLPEAVRGYSSARLVPAGDPAALADAVQRTLADLDEATTAAAQDAVAARVRHDPARYADVVRERLLDAVGGTERRVREYST